MNKVLTRRQDARVSRWAGGTTTELCIWPPQADVAQRSFTFRLSTATVELAESVFSDFSGFTRHIMPLEGCMELWHNGQRAVRLQPYEGHTFDGGWETRSVGACVDVNLIHKPELQGALQVIYGTGCARLPLKGHAGIYARCAELAISGVEQGKAFTCTLRKDDFLLLTCGEGACTGEIRLAAADATTGSASAPAAVLALLTMNA